MWQAFERWSYTNLGQWHYVLGYTIHLVSHNWPIMLAVLLCPWLAYRAYRQPDRSSVSWLLTTILFGLTYEYWKHVAGELHQAIDFLFGMELASLNGPLHVVVGDGCTAALLIACAAMLAQALRLTVTTWNEQYRSRAMLKEIGYDE